MDVPVVFDTNQFCVAYLESLTPSLCCLHSPPPPPPEIEYLLSTVNVAGCLDMTVTQTSTSFVLSTQPPFMDVLLINHSKGSPTKCHENKAVVQAWLHEGGDILRTPKRSLENKMWSGTRAKARGYGMSRQTGMEFQSNMDNLVILCVD